jgi:hypothetical protein
VEESCISVARTGGKGIWEQRRINVNKKTDIKGNLK